MAKPSPLSGSLTTAPHGGEGWGGAPIDNAIAVGFYHRVENTSEDRLGRGVDGRCGRSEAKDNSYWLRSR